MPKEYPWPRGHRGACVISVDVDGEVPLLWRSRGESLRLAELEQRRFGPRAGLPRLLDLFADANITASFYVPGYYVDTYPRQVAAIAEAGHEIGLHGYLHEPPTQVSKSDFRAALERGTDSILEVVGVRPAGFRSPSWDMTADAFDALVEFGLGYDSSMMGLDLPYRLGGITEIPVQWTLDDAPFYRYVGAGTSSYPPVRPKELAARWCEELDAAGTYNTLAVITVHDWLSGRATAASALSEVLQHLQDSGLWCATAREVARWHEALGPAGGSSWPLPEGATHDA